MAHHSSPASTAVPPHRRTAAPTNEPVVVPVYFMIDTRTGLRLACEQRAVAGADPNRSAVEAIIARPTDCTTA